MWRTPLDREAARLTSPAPEIDRRQDKDFITAAATSARMMAGLAGQERGWRPFRQRVLRPWAECARVGNKRHGAGEPAGDLVDGAATTLAEPGSQLQQRLMSLPAVTARSQATTLTKVGDPSSGKSANMRRSPSFEQRRRAFPRRGARAYRALSGGQGPGPKDRPIRPPPSTPAAAGPRSRLVDPGCGQRLHGGRRQQRQRSLQPANCRTAGQPPTGLAETGFVSQMSGLLTGIDLGHRVTLIPHATGFRLSSAISGVTSMARLQRRRRRRGEPAGHGALAGSAFANDSTAELTAGGLVLKKNAAIEMRSRTSTSPTSW